MTRFISDRAESASPILAAFSKRSATETLASSLLYKPRCRALKSTYMSFSIYDKSILVTNSKIEKNTQTHLLAEFILDVAFHTPQHEWLQDHMKTPQLMLVELAAFVLGGALDVFGEPLVEFVMRVKQTRHYKME